MIKLKTPEEINLIRKSSELVSKSLSVVAGFIKPGVSSLELDKIAEEVIRDNGGVPAFLNYKGFPNSICASKNEQVVHGIPDATPLKEGDIISLDCGVEMNGFFGDSAYTFAVGEIDPKVEKLMRVTKQALMRGVANAIEGKRIGDIAWAVQDLAEKQNNYGVVRELVGHGIGEELHESPEVPNFGRRGKGLKLEVGMVIAIEPMVNLQTRHVMTAEDDWTIVTRDGKPSAHFEHTVAIGKGVPDILSDFEIIEKAIRNNPELLLVEV